MLVNARRLIRKLRGGAQAHLMECDDEAATQLQRALEIRPKADIYANLGTIRFYQGRYAESVAAFEKATELSDGSYDMWGGLGDAYRWTPGYQGKARTAYDRAIDLVRQEIGNIESKKAESALYSPIAGTLTQFNEMLLKDPSAINVDKYGGGWLFEMVGASDSLLSPAEYVQHLQSVWEITQRTIKGQLNE